MQTEEFLEIGRTKARMSRFPESLNAYQAAIDRDPSSGEAWYGKAQQLEALGRYIEAIEAFEHAISLAHAPDGRSRYEIGNIRRDLGDLHRALNDFAAATAIDPTLEQAWFNRACVLLDLGRLGEAADDFERAAALDPVDIRIALWQGDCLAQLGRHLEAEACFARARASQSPSDLAREWLRLGSHMFAQKRDEAAIEAYDRSSQMNARWGVPWLNRGAALRRLGRDDLALASFERAAASNDEATLVAWIDIAALSEQRGKPAAARAAYERVVAVPPRAAADYEAHACALRHLGQYDAALTAATKARALDRLDRQPLMEQAACLEALGRAADAIAILDEAVLRFPTSSEAWSRLADRMGAAGNHERAADCAQKAIALGDSSSSLQMRLAVALGMLGKLDAAEAAFQAVLVKEPRSSVVWFDLAICQLQLGKKVECLSALDRSLALAPDMTDALRAKAHLLREMRRTSEADSVIALGLAQDLFNAEPQRTQEGVDRLQQAIGLDPNNLVAGRLFGEILFQSGQLLEQAEWHLTRWTDTWPDDEGVWQTRAQLLHKLGRPEEATACYARAIAANPQSARALRNAAVDAFTREQYEEALALSMRSLQIEGENSDALYGVGVCQARLGKLPEAVDALRQAVAINPEDIEAWKDMTTCLNSLGRYSEAADAWKRVQAFDPHVDLRAGLEGQGLRRMGNTTNVWIQNDSSAVTDKDQRGAALLARGDHRGAAEAFDEVLALDPARAEVWVERGICAEILEGPDLAVHYFDRALAIEPELGRALYNKGVSLFRLKQHDLAIDAYQRVLAIYDSKKLASDQDYVHSWYNMGLVRLVLHEFEPALDCFDRVLVIARDAPGQWQEEARRAEEAKSMVYDAALLALKLSQRS